MAGDKNVTDEKPVQEARPTPVEYGALDKILPSYDGNKRTLMFYIEGVENALEFIANRNDNILACIIRNKLTGKAVEALSESPGAKTWDDIKSILKKKFGEFRTEIQLVQELMNTSRENNSLDTFGNQIRSLMSSLISIEPERRHYYEKMALETFLDKLNPITSILIKLNHVENLDQAVILAKQEELKLRVRRNIQHKPSANKPSTSSNKFQKPFISNKNNTVNKKPTLQKEETFKNKFNFQKITEDDDDESSSEDEPDISEENQEENFLLDILNTEII